MENQERDLVVFKDENDKESLCYNFKPVIKNY